MASNISPFGTQVAVELQNKLPSGFVTYLTTSELEIQATGGGHIRRFRYMWGNPRVSQTCLRDHVASTIYTVHSVLFLLIRRISYHVLCNFSLNINRILTFPSSSTNLIFDWDRYFMLSILDLLSNLKSKDQEHSRWLRVSNCYTNSGNCADCMHEFEISQPIWS